jgi:hypothetical protein
MTTAPTRPSPATISRDGTRTSPNAVVLVPALATLLARALVLGFVALGVFFLDRASWLLMDYWLLESLGFAGIFWTNFWTGLLLFIVGFALFAAAVAAPAFFSGDSSRRRSLQLGALVGLVAGYVLAQRYPELLLLAHGTSFGEVDPIFGKDAAFYVFDLPAYKTATTVALLAGAALLVSSLVHGLVRGGRRGLVRSITAPPTLVAIGVLAVAGAAELWLMRYGLLTEAHRDEQRASIYGGPHVLDVSGLFSTMNLFGLGAICALVLGGLLVYRLRRAGSEGPRVRPLLVAAAPVAVFMGFWGLVELRDQTQVTPNEPVVQLPYIKHHIEATNAAWTMDRIETIPFAPKAGNAPKPNVEKLLEHPTFANAPLWPGYVSWFERVIDPQYVQRILESGEDTQIYGPTLDMFRQQQKLRPYYDFMDVDTTRYRVGDETVMVASSVRELPLIEPKPWLAWWGQRFVIFTHGHGLVAVPTSGVSDEGEPSYASGGLPHNATVGALQLDQPGVYYGEGSATVAFSNLDSIQEHDFPTEQGRAQSSFPPDLDGGIELDSLLKRIVFGYRSGSLLDIVFSDLVTDRSRVHYARTPLERVQKIAPFLYLDSDPFAVAADGRIVWMVNGLTTSDSYPYSASAEIGDEADRRTPTAQPARIVNYARDAVKVTIDSFTGKVDFYAIEDEPVVRTWAAIYPELFRSGDAMPTEVRQQLQYPVQLMHAIFDDLYIYFHQRDPLTFFSWEDVFDDADEVKGDLLAEGGSVSFSIEPYYWIAETGGSLPASTSRTQFALSTVFTPEGARNLRAIATVYMDGEDYGKLSILQVPKGRFFPGPEQADAAIDQDAFISQQISLWNRLGLDVIRGHTTPLVVAGEVFYVEPLFIKSAQNPFPQLKRVIVVFRGRAAMGESLAEALRIAVGDERQRATPAGVP